MPNWCQNKITISPIDSKVGYREMFQFMKRLLTVQKSEERLSFFEIFYPIPESESKNWYEWCCQNWGTKWDIDIDVNDVSAYKSEIRDIII
jgi:hypothetical protein